MNKKQVISSALAGMMIAGTTGFTAFAAMPDGVVVLKDRAYALSYLEDKANKKEILDQMKVTDLENEFFIKVSNKWMTNDKKFADVSKIPAVTYKDAEGKETKYDAKDGDAVVDGDFKVVEISAVGAKKLQVNFNQPVEDATKLTYNIKRDGANVTIAKDSAVWNEDKTQLTLETSYALMTGNYVVTAKVADGEETKAEAKIEAAKVTEITIDDKAVLAKDTTNSLVTDWNKVTVGIRFFNQYGEDVTTQLKGSATVLPQYTSNKNSYVNGIATLDRATANPYRLGEKIPVSVIYTEQTSEGFISLTQNLDVTVVEAANIATLELGDVTTDNKDLKDMPIYVKNLTAVGTEAVGNYYIPVVAKDQYGKDVEIVESDLLSKVPTNPAITLELREVNNKPVLAIKKNATPQFVGEVGVTVVTKTGKSATTKFELMNNATLTSIKFNQPEKLLIQGGEYVDITYTAMDQYGTQLKSSDEITVKNATTTSIVLDGVINNISQDITINISGGQIESYIDYANKKERKFRVKANAGQQQVILTVIAGANTQTVMLPTVSASEAKSIVDFKIKDDYKKLQVGASGNTELKVKDQYDLEYTFKKNTDGEAIEKMQYTSSDNSKVTVDPNTGVVTAVAKGTAKITAELFRQNADKTWSAVSGVPKKEISIEVVDSISKYDVELSNDKLYVGTDRVDAAVNADSNHDIEATLVGYDKESNKIKLVQEDPASAGEVEFVSSLGADITTTSGIVFNGKKGNINTTGTYVVKVGGNVINKTVTITSEARKEQAMQIFKGKTEITSGTVSADRNDANSAFVGLAGIVKDQYGVKYNVSVYYNKSLSTVEASDEVEVTFVSPNGQTKKVVVVVTK